MLEEEPRASTGSRKAPQAKPKKGKGKGKEAPATDERKLSPAGEERLKKLRADPNLPHRQEMIHVAKMDYAETGLAYALAQAAVEAGLHVTDMVELPAEMKKAGLPVKVSGHVARLGHQMNRDMIDGHLWRYNWTPVYAQLLFEKPPELTGEQARKVIEQMESKEDIDPADVLTPAPPPLSELGKLYRKQTGAKTHGESAADACRSPAGWGLRAGDMVVAGLEAGERPRKTVPTAAEEAAGAPGGDGWDRASKGSSRVVEASREEAPARSRATGLKILGHPAAAVVRWMGANGVPLAKCQSILDKLGIGFSPSTVKLNWTAGKNHDPSRYGDPATLSKAEAKELLK